MLIYHPVEDSNHCTYRIIRLLFHISIQSIPQSTLMICDFYALFPGQLKNIKGWPRANSKSYKTVQQIPDEYEQIVNSRRIFYQLKDIQLAALSYLHAKEVITLLPGVDRKIQLNKDSVPQSIVTMIQNDEYCETDWFRLITNELPKIDLYGKSGLKGKTGLMEYVYD